jgi:membrane fusion protein, multidrug efflux system
VNTSNRGAVTRRAARAGLLTLAGLLALAAGCSNGKAKDKDADATETTVPVEVQPVRRAAMVAVYSGTAPIEAHDEAEVVAKVGGEVRQIYVEEGDNVAAGQILARLDGDRLRLEAAEAQAKLRKLERDVTRFKELSQKGLVAKNELENAEFDLDALRASYERTRLELSYTEIRAPIAGVISARHIKVGNTISANSQGRADPTFRVTDLDPLVAYVHIPEKEFRKLAPGQAAEVVVDALGGTRFAATIAFISPTVDPQTGTFRARLEVPDSSQRLKPGMFARVNIVYERRENALQVPRNAILDSDGAQSVFVVAGGKAEQRKIVPGLINGGWVEVKEGLTGDERIVVVGQGGLKSGTLVKVVDTEAGVPAVAVKSR